LYICLSVHPSVITAFAESILMPIKKRRESKNCYKMV
jgi:hypothetical protein